MLVVAEAEAEAEANVSAAFPSIVGMIWDGVISCACSGVICCAWVSVVCCATDVGTNDRMSMSKELSPLHVANGCCCCPSAASTLTVGFISERAKVGR
jgi:hypothetical protein